MCNGIPEREDKQNEAETIIMEQTEEHFSESRSANEKCSQYTFKI